MQNQGRKTEHPVSYQPWWAHPLVVVAATIVVVIVSITFLSKSREVEPTDRTTVLDQEINQITRDVSLLKDQVTEATSAATLEKLIREQLLMKKEGEYIVQIPIDALPSPSPLPTVKPPTNLQQWWTVFK